MNYTKIYTSLIDNRQLLYFDRKQLKKQKLEYYEHHHIIPRCMNGNNNIKNLVYLTAREHFLAHWLLWKIYRTKQLAYAFIRMSTNKNIRITGKQYEITRKIRSEVYSGENSPKGFKGKHHTNEVKQRQSVSKIGVKNPMFGLGENHPNCKRVGELNPNFGLLPWKNPSVLRTPSAINIWNNRDILYQTWIQLNKPHWYKFGKEAIYYFDTNGYEYIPHSFRKMVNWFEKSVCERVPI